MKRTQILPTFFAVVAAAGILALSSCGSKGADGAQRAELETADKEAVMVTSRAMNAAAPKAMAMADTAMEENVQATSAGAEAGTGAATGTERKLIKTGSIRLEVENLASAEEAVTGWCASFGGYISASYSEERRASFTVRIPAQDFDSAMTAVGTLGAVKSRSVSTQDVSEQFYDLQTRLDTRKILRDRLQSYLASAKDMKDMLQIESELNDTLSEIESMEGRMRRLAGQIDYSTITVEAELPYRTTDQGFQWPELGNGLRRFASNIVDFFAGFAAVLLYAVICGIPVLAAAAFFYWLLLGKAGLLKKIFRRLRGKKE